MMEKPGDTADLPARENRSFLQRAVRFLAEEARIGQFLDIGAGPPGSTHEIAQRRVPRSRIVYVGNSPRTVAHSPLTGSPDGAVSHLEGDLRDPRLILGDPRLTEILDLTRPVALILVPVPNVAPGHVRTRDNVRELLAALPSGSYLAASSFTLDYGTSEQVAIARAAVAQRGPDTHPRNLAEFAEFFTGLGLIGPGIVPVSEWLPEVPAHQRPSPERTALYGAVGRKP